MKQPGMSTISPPCLPLLAIHLGRMHVQTSACRQHVPPAAPGTGLQVSQLCCLAVHSLIQICEKRTFAACSRLHPACSHHSSCRATGQLVDIAGFFGECRLKLPVQKKTSPLTKHCMF